MSDGSALPEVRRVITTHGSHVEPPCDDSWDDLTKLRWCAAVSAMDAGLDPAQLHVGHSPANSRRAGFRGKVRVPLPDRFYVRVGSSTGGAYTFEHAWAFLDGISTGARLVRGDFS